MTTKFQTAETAPLNLPTAEEAHRNLTNIVREQIIGAAKAGDDERLDYWLARYVELGKIEGRAGHRSGRRAAS